MEKKYQVFVSSTYLDLKEERRKVMEVLLNRDCIPVGMEFFPSANEELVPMIERFIDECDYYILIVANRYGEIDKQKGISYTQIEYECARKKGIPIAIFICNDKNKDSREESEEKQSKLEAFKKQLKSYSYKEWSTPDNLAANVCLSLGHLIKNHPRPGWVKVNTISSDEANREILTLRKENNKLKKQLDFLSSSVPQGTENFQQGEDKFSIRYKAFNPMEEEYDDAICHEEKTWNEIFACVSTLLLNLADRDTIKEKLEKDLLSEYDEIIEEDFQTIIIQLMALKLINVVPVANIIQPTYWMLTSYGRAEMVRLKAIKKNN